MPGTFPLAAEFKGKHELAIPACISARASRTCRDACRDYLPALSGKTFPAFPAHAHPQFDVFGKRPMASQKKTFAQPALFDIGDLKGHLTMVVLKTFTGDMIMENCPPTSMSITTKPLRLTCRQKSLTTMVVTEERCPNALKWFATAWEESTRVGIWCTQQYTEHRWYENSL